MKKKRFLIFDLGASNGRAIVAAFDGSRAEMEVTYRFDNTPIIAAGTLYWDILRLFSEVKTGLRLSLAKYPDIVSVAVDTWGCDFGFIDKNGRLLGNPVSYRDVLRHQRASLLYESLPRRELFHLCGGSTNEIMGLYQLFSYKCDDSPELREGSQLLMIPDLLNYLLTGKACNEYTNATMTLLCDQRKKTWERAILARLGIPDSFLRNLIMPGSPIAGLQKQVCEELGIRPISVVAPATHDTASAVTGIPVTDGTKAWAFISMGTWSIAGMETRQPVITDHVFDAGYGNNAIADGRNMLVNYITGLWIIQQCRQKWIKDLGRDIAWPEIVEESEKAGPATAYINVDDPSFTQMIPDMPGAIVRYCRNRGQKLENSMGAVSRTVYESLVLKYRENLKTLETLTQSRLDQLNIVGGGIQNHTLCQWTADAVGIPVFAGPAETTSMGNLLMQLKCAGEISSLEQGREISLKSSEVIRYEPGAGEPWDNAAGKFQAIVSSAVIK
ncbi:MAG: rhamnulokinase family protein [bacterium]|jgi:rhamnulokinase|uniref:Carbohydrate kinase, FGGY n=1 Tax=uncultured Spirochaetota bacterium TaxID=460511 RepID=A0A652ZWX6_9SPIR|nr:Carbohydrate kinase, FGGY [uncultured Spirochaetota bacterium]